MNIEIIKWQVRLNAVLEEERKTEMDTLDELIHKDVNGYMMLRMILSEQIADLYDPTKLFERYQAGGQRSVR